MGLDAKVQVDLMVVGSVAVSEKGKLVPFTGFYSIINPVCIFFCLKAELLISLGYRIGKGEGFADMEYAMMASMGAVKDSTVVVTVVHDCQVENLLLIYIQT